MYKGLLSITVIAGFVLAGCTQYPGPVNYPAYRAASGGSNPPPHPVPDFVVEQGGGSSS